MEARTAYDKGERAEGGVGHRPQTCSWDCWAWGAIVGIGGGIAAIVFGSALTAVAWFAGAGSYAGTAGTVLLLAAIPLLTVGAQSLDVDEKRGRARREARQHEDS